MASKERPRSGGTPVRTTKAERKEQARRKRLEIQRRMERARRNRTIAIAVGLVVGVAVVAVMALTSGDEGGKEDGSAPLAGLMTGAPPWTANTGDLATRLRELTLPPVGGALHIHSHLDVFVNGSAVTVPQSLGISSDAESPIHTHDETGVVHLESADPNSTFTLGEFFDVWGLKLTPTCIGGYCESGDSTLRLFVDGKPYDGDPRSLQLKDREDIVVTFGTNDQVPDPLPTFDWSTLTP